MRIFNKFRSTRGFISLWEQMLRFRYMITEQAKQRVRILAFWEKRGAAAAEEAFNVSRRTLYRWQASLRRQRVLFLKRRPSLNQPRETIHL